MGKHTHVYAGRRRAGKSAAMTVINKNLELIRLHLSELGELRLQVVQPGASPTIPRVWTLIQMDKSCAAEVNIEISFQRGLVERLVTEKPHVMSSAEVLGQHERFLLTSASGLHV